ncbi:AraC family transcriptional regulator [Ectobacillus funiculus]|uniref:helix-turn-helix transcriptional regulator n=1 Tax=Ectobacillus funiculus TaxID=137993 RepID=UPI0039797AD4
MDDAISIEEKLKQPLHFYQVLIFLQKEAFAIPGAAEKVCEQAVAYIQRYYNRQLKMTDIAQELHYHADYLTRCMQKNDGGRPASIFK